METLVPLPALLARTNTPFLRFLIVGISNTIVGYVLFIAFELVLRLVPMTREPNGIQWRPVTAYLAAYCIATAWAFFWHQRYTFNVASDTRRNTTKILFFALQASLALGGSYLLNSIIRYTGLAHYIAWLPVVAVTTITNYLVSKAIFTNE